MTTQPSAPSFPYRWWILAAVVGVSLMTPLDSSAVNIAIPVLQQTFQISYGLAAWVSLVYLLVITSLILPLGRLGDLWGFRRLFLLGIVIFTSASALCGLAPTLPWLIAGRVVQGVGACLMMALSPGITTAIFPPQERGRALGIMGMGIAVGLVIGPTLGGFLVSQAGWRWIFYINLPIGVLGGIWCWRLLPHLGGTVRRRIDWHGAWLAIVLLGTLLLVVTQGDAWGWRSPRLLSLLFVCVTVGVAFVIVERRQTAPMLPLSLFANRTFSGANLAAMMNFLGQFCAIFLTPVLLQDALGYSAEAAGRVMGVLPLAVLVLAPMSGALSDRLGTRALAVIGETLVAGGLACLAFVIVSGHLAGIAASLALVGVGTGIFQSPNNSAIMGSVPRSHLGIGGGVLATMRNLGMALGIAISSSVAAIGQHAYQSAHPGVSAATALVHGIRLGFLAGAGFALLGALTSLLRQDQRHVEPGAGLEARLRRD